MKNYILIIVSLLLCLVSCVKAPATKPQQETPEEPSIDPKPEDDPGKKEEEEEKKNKEVTLMSTFTEDFSSRDSEYFTFAYHQTGDDFRYYPGFPSMTENGKDILMLRLDPSDKEGEENGSVLSSKDYVYYGSYSARIKLPSISSVQPNLGACAMLSLRDDHPTWGYDEVSLELRLADKKNIYLQLVHQEPGDGSCPTTSESVKKPSIGSFNADSKYYIYGIDWSEKKITWWLKTSTSSSKTTLYELTENVPTQPLRLEFRMFHSKKRPAQDKSSSTQAPLYPYELEIDWIKYTPSK